MITGTRFRLDRIGSDGRYLIVPMDHGLTMGPVDGLRDIEHTISAVTRGGADAVLTQKGIAHRVTSQLHDAGYIVHLNGSTEIGPDESDKRLTGTVKEAVRAGADAVSFHINVSSTHEPEQLAALGELTGQATEYGMPVLAMAYARGPDVAEDDPEALAHAVRLAEELGADLVKTGYSGDAASFSQVVAGTRLPVVIAGGSRGTNRETLEMVRGAMDAGGAGVSMGRSIFQHDRPEAITRAIAAIVHDDTTVQTALDRAGLG